MNIHGFASVTRARIFKAAQLCWGRIAHWAKDQKIVYRTINAQAETVDKARPTGRHSASAAACCSGPRT
jgi:putative SOS response-associated peptidase YedK